MPQKIETKIGSLAELVPQFESGTCFTSAELTNERRTAMALKDRWFYTANFALYAVENGNAFLYFGGKKNNPIFNNFEEASKQLVNNGNYVPSKEEMESAKESAVRMNLEDLCFKQYDNQFSFFEIDSKNYDSLNATQRLFAEAVYGQGNNFVKNMNFFAQTGMVFSTVYALNKDYVMKNVQNDGAIVRACWLSYSSTFSRFYANYYRVSDPNALRGLVKVMPKTEPQKDLLKITDIDYNLAYQILMANPQQLDDEKAVGLSKLLIDYLMQKKR